MVLAKTLFWIAIIAMIYHFIGYPLLLLIINSFKKTYQNQMVNDILIYPKIIILCPAYNEEARIEEKIKSFLALDYPQDKIKMIVISDNSIDHTNEIVSKYLDQRIKLIIQAERGGKQKAQNSALPYLDCDFVVSTDANSIFAPDAIKVLVKKILSNPDIGMVSGELLLLHKGDKSSGEGLYWKYESYLKLLESKFYSLIGANGSLYLIKRALFNKIDPQSVDDFERALIVLKNHQIVSYEPDAKVSEEESKSAKQELGRKVRIISREWQVVKRNRELLNPFRYPIISFQLFSHKILRWLIFVFLLMVFFASLYLINIKFFRIVLILQCIFYGWGIIGLIAQSKEKKMPLSRIPAYICVMFYSSLKAFMYFIGKKTSGIWEPLR